MATLQYLWKNRVKSNDRKFSLFKFWGKRLLTLPEVLRKEIRRKKLVNGGANIHPTAEIGFVKAMGKKINLSVGANSFLGRVNLALHDTIQIGSRVCINDGVLILTASHDIQDPAWPLLKNPIIIEDYAWIAVNAIILPGVRIGKGAVVGAGAVVSKDVEAFSVVVGNPARPVANKRAENLNYNPCEFLAGNMAWLNK